MTTKLNSNNPLTHLKTGYNNMLLTLQLKEDIHVFEEKPRVDPGQGPEERKEAHELFSLFTADIIKNKVIFLR
jgi:hypothetical protein